MSHLRLAVGILTQALLVLMPTSARGDLFVSNTDTNQILRFDSTTGAPIGTGVFVSAGSAGLSLPLGLVFGPDGNLFVMSTGTHQVLEYDGRTGLPVGNGVFVNAGGVDLAFGPNGNLFIGSNGILEYDGRTGAPIGSGVFVPLGSAGLGSPSGLAFGPNGNLYVSDISNNDVLEFDGTTGAPVGTGVIVPPGSAGLSIPQGLTFGPNGNLFVSSQGSIRVLEFDSSTGLPVGTGQFVPNHSAGLRGPYGLAFGPNGNLFVSNTPAPQGGEAGAQVLEYDGFTGFPVGNGVFIPTGSAGLSEPTFLTFSPVVPVTVPESASLLFFGVGLAGLLGVAALGLCDRRLSGRRLRIATVFTVQGDWDAPAVSILLPGTSAKVDQHWQSQLAD